MNKKIASYLERGKRDGRSLLALQGARRAGKTYTSCQWLLLQMLTEGDTVIFASMTAEQGRKGAYEDCKTILSSWGALSQYYDVFKSPREIQCKTTVGNKRGVAYFSSYQDPESAKGGACDWVFINEANKFSKQQYLDLAANARKGVIVDYNPNVRFWIEDVIADDEVLKCSWQDNKTHLTTAQLDWFAQLYNSAHSPTATSADMYYYKVYYLGEYAEVSGAIFTRANTTIVQPDEVDFSTLKNFVIFGDPSALRGADSFPLVLSATGPDGKVYIVDVFSTNVGTREDIVRKIREMAVQFDNVTIYIETNGLVGIEFYEFAVNSGLPIIAWTSRGNKFDRIVSKYQDWKHNLVFVDNARLNKFLEMCYEFDEHCEHDDNPDAVATSLSLQKFLNAN